MIINLNNRKSLKALKSLTRQRLLKTVIPIETEMVESHQKSDTATLAEAIENTATTNESSENIVKESKLKELAK